MDTLLQELSKLSAGTLTTIAALAGATGAVVAALVTAIVGKIIVSPFLGARDKQDKEAEWRKHAVELTKLDLDRKLKTRAETDKSSVRPCILDFLANYRDLQELGTKSPKELFIEIKEKRITKASNPVSAAARIDQAPPFLSNKLRLGMSLLVLLLAARFRSRR
jgi:hypothetical protein